MSEYRYTQQVASANMKTKDGSNVVFAAEHTFPEYFLQSFLESGASLEMSGLDRFILRMNKKPQSGATIMLTANLPMSDVGALWTLSEQIYKDSILEPKKYSERQSIEIYAPPAKFRRTKTPDEKENECYTIKIVYNPNNRMPIQITMENFLAPVNRMPDKTVQIQLSQAHNKKSVNIWLRIQDWFEFIDALKSERDAYLTASFTNRFRKSLIGKNK